MFGSADPRNLLELFPLMMGIFRWICWESAVRQYAIRMRVMRACTALEFTREFNLHELVS